MIRRRLKVCVGLVLTTMVFACTDPKLTALEPAAKILAFGDSLTAGKGVKPEQSYPAELQRLISRTVVNAGISGETTAQGLRRLETVLDREQPDLVILIEGGNDILRNLDLKQTESNLAHMIELIQSRKAQVVLLGIPLKTVFSASCADFYDRLAERYSVPLDCDSIGKLLRNTQYKSDAIHFNQAGYARMAKAVVELMEEEGAL